MRSLNLPRLTHLLCPTPNMVTVLLEGDGVEAALPLWGDGGGGGFCRLRSPRAVTAPEAESQQTGEPGDTLLGTLVDGVYQRLLAEIRFVRRALLFFLFLRLLGLLGCLPLIRSKTYRVVIF